MCSLVWEISAFAFSVFQVLIFLVLLLSVIFVHVQIIVHFLQVSNPKYKYCDEVQCKDIWVNTRLSSSQILPFHCLFPPLNPRQLLILWLINVPEYCFCLRRKVRKSLRTFLLPQYLIPRILLYTNIHFMKHLFFSLSIFLLSPSFLPVGVLEVCYTLRLFIKIEQQGQLYCPLCWEWVLEKPGWVGFWARWSSGWQGQGGLELDGL